MPAWYESRYTGLFSTLVRAPQRAHDPSVHVTAAQTPPWHASEPELGGSGAGWTKMDADLACVGESIERLLARALPRDGFVESSWNTWPLDEPAIAPDRWTLFHDEQYASEGFPFVPLAADTTFRWVCCRAALTGEPVWVPEEMVYILPRPEERQHHAPGFSTGLTCGRSDQRVLFRGVQEVIERDALVGFWWRNYSAEMWPAEQVRALLGNSVWDRIDRPNLEYRFYRLHSPYSEHVTLVSVSGIDQEGWVFSVGSACRESLRASWEKSLLEAIQGRHCVRRLMAQWHDEGQPELAVPTTFFDHALYYAIHPERLAETALHDAIEPHGEVDVHRTEDLSDIANRLGDDHPILFRNLTPPGIAPDPSRWLVLRVVIPGLQPLHGDHRLPFLGGPLWEPRAWADWQTIPPHPFA